MFARQFLQDVLTTRLPLLVVGMTRSLDDCRGYSGVVSVWEGGFGCDCLGLISASGNCWKLCLFSSKAENALESKLRMFRASYLNPFYYLSLVVNHS